MESGLIVIPQELTYTKSRRRTSPVCFRTSFQTANPHFRRTTLKMIPHNHDRFIQTGITVCKRIIIYRTYWTVFFYPLFIRSFFSSGRSKHIYIIQRNRTSAISSSRISVRITGRTEIHPVIRIPESSKITESSYQNLTVITIGITSGESLPISLRIPRLRLYQLVYIPVPGILCKELFTSRYHSLPPFPLIIAIPHHLVDILRRYLADIACYGATSLQIRLIRIKKRTGCQQKHPDLQSQCSSFGKTPVIYGSYPPWQFISCIVT